jgi:ligand-binding sensor domain-containing protein
MTKQLFSWAAIFTLTLAFTSCKGQVKTDSPKDNQITGGKSKFIKNNFFPDLAEEFKFVQCELQDKKGNMWFGTAGNGIYVYNGDSFVNLNYKSFINFSLQNDLNHNDILCCMEDKTGHIWFGTRRGLIQYKPSGAKPEGKDFILYLIPENTISGSTRTRLPYTLQSGDNFVWSIMQDKSGKIWFGTSRGVYVHNPYTDIDNAGPLFKRFFDCHSLTNNQHLQLVNVTSMLEDRNGNIWFVSPYWTANKGEGIVRYDGKSLVNFTPDSTYSFRSIIERKNGDLLFLASFNGVYSYDGKTFSNLNEKIGIKNDTIISMLEDGNGNIWFGHISDNAKNGGDGGLWHFDGKSLKLFTIKDGLSHNHVMCMTEDKYGNIWFGTRNTGLCRYDGKTFTNYTE